MSKYIHVLNSYTSRGRFWIFGVCYLAFSNVDNPEDQKPLICVSVLLASVVMGLIALHLRRQFATPQPHLTPDFFLPHFVVAALLSAGVWIAVPWWEATNMHLPPRVVIGAHAVAAVLMAAVVMWPKMIVAIPATPLFVAWLLVPRKESDSLAAEFMAGDAQAVYWGLAAAAVLGYVLAAWRLARLSDVHVATSDDFSLEQPGGEVSRNPVIERMLAWRDAAIDRRLATAARRGHSARLRRIPSTVSWQELALLPILILALLPLAWYAVGDPAGGWLVLLSGLGLMLFAPFSSWRFRLNALAMESMRPATRGQCLREIFAAMALDFCAWAAMATVVVFCGALMVSGQDGFGFPIVLAAHVAGLWSLAVLLFGIGLVTLRFRAWMPLFIALLFASVFAAASAIPLVTPWLPRHPNSAYIVVATFAAVCVTIGLGLSWAIYRHWLKMDLS